MKVLSSNKGVERLRYAVRKVRTKMLQTDDAWEQVLFEVEDMQCQRAAAPQQCRNIQSIEVSRTVLKPSPSAVKCQSAVILTVVSLPPQLHCPSIWSVTLASTVGFVATAGRIWSVNDEDVSQQSFDDFGGGFKQFWVFFWQKSKFFLGQKGQKKSILCQKSSKKVQK